MVIKAIPSLVCWAGKATAGSAETWEELQSQARQGGKAGGRGHCPKARNLRELWRQSRPMRRPDGVTPPSVVKAEIQNLWINKCICPN